MSEVPQEQQQQPQQQEEPQQAPRTQAEADESLFTKFVAPERPRDERGRFAPQGQQAQGEAPPQEQAPAEQQQAPAEQAPAETQEYNWDEVKTIKLKVPFKTGDKEWVEELPLEELRNRGMMQADYQARRAEMESKLRIEQEKAQQAVQLERQQYVKNLNTLHQSVMQVAATELANVDWTKLAQENPAEYVRLSNRAAQLNAQLERVRFEHERVTKQQDEDRQKRLETAKSEARQKLQAKLPTWNDDLHKSLEKRAQDTYGFKPEEFSQVWDERVLQLFHDAHQFRLLSEKKPAADAQVRDAPPVLRPGNVKPRVNPQEQQKKDVVDRLRRDGNDRDAAEALMATFLTPKTQGRPR